MRSSGVRVYGVAAVVLLAAAGALAAAWASASATAPASCPSQRQGVDERTRASSCSAAPPELQAPNRTPIPYPTPAGEGVKPRLGDVPAFPGAVEIDGWRRTSIYVAINGAEFELDEAVQLFETRAEPAEIIGFYLEHYRERAWIVRRGIRSVWGETIRFERPAGEVHHVTVTTVFQARPGVELGDLPPGYLDTGERLLSPVEGTTWFFVITGRNGPGGGPWVFVVFGALLAAPFLVWAVFDIGWIRRRRRAVEASHAPQTWT